MSTSSRSATSCALRSGLTLKPMTTASEAVASSTSDSLMAPTPLWMIRIFTFSSELRERVGQHLGRALHVGLDDDRQLLHAALGICCCSDSSVRRPPFVPAPSPSPASAGSRDLPRLGGSSIDLERVARRGQRRQAEHFDRASMVRPTSPGGRGRRKRPDLADDGCPAMTGHRREGAVLDEHCRDRPAAAVELRFEHRPDAPRFGLALSSPMSATSRIISSSSSRFSRFLAETSTKTVWPPHSSGMRPRSDSSRLTRSGWRPACRSC
jgi:hypothetical protein